MQRWRVSPVCLLPEARFHIVLENLRHASEGENRLSNRTVSDEDTTQYISRTLGTPTKMLLFNADSRISAAFWTASARLRRVAASSASFLVTNLYRWPTEDGAFTVRSVQVCVDP